MSQKKQVPFTEEFPFNLVGVGTMIPGQTYVFMLRARLPGSKASGVTIAKKQQLEDNGVAAKFSGEFVGFGRDRLWGHDYAIFKNIKIHGKHHVISYDSGKIKVPNLDLETIDKPVYGPDGHVRDMKTPGHQYLDLKSFGDKQLGFRLNKYIFGEKLFDEKAQLKNIISKKMGVNIHELKAFIGDADEDNLFKIRYYISAVFSDNDEIRHKLFNHTRTLPYDKQREVAIALEAYQGDAEGGKKYLLSLLEPAKSSHKSSNSLYDKEMEATMASIRNYEGESKKRKTQKRATTTSRKRATTSRKRSSSHKKSSSSSPKFTQAQLAQARGELILNGNNDPTDEEIIAMARTLRNNGAF